MISNLNDLSIVNSGLNDEMAVTLALLLTTSKVKHLDLSNNLINDLTPLLKLCSTQQTNFLESLNVQRNNLTHPTCFQLMKALK
jgi:Leucine-rich repeat (LRR) protein